jgi:hypothetical protein
MLGKKWGLGIHPLIKVISADPCRQQGERVREELIKG